MLSVLGRIFVLERIPLQHSLVKFIFHCSKPIFCLLEALSELLISVYSNIQLLSCGFVVLLILLALLLEPVSFIPELLYLLIQLI
jgi:hypothetical protein